MQKQMQSSVDKAVNRMAQQEQFCDANCVWTDHHPDCKLAQTQEPPQRTWVGLASEDRLTAKYMQDAPDGIEAVIDYIEAKLKELNT